MFKNNNEQNEEKVEKTKLDELIDGLEKKLEHMDPTDEDYELVVNNLKRFAELKSYRENAELEKQSKKKHLNDAEKKQIDPNVGLQVGGLLVATILCIHAETTGNITTKAFGFIPKLIGIRRV